MGRNLNSKKRTYSKKMQKTKKASGRNKGAEHAASNSCESVTPASVDHTIEGSPTKQYQEIEQDFAEVWKSIWRQETLFDALTTADTT